VDCWRLFVIALEKKSPCKVNLLLNILGKRPDGFHELETVMHPVAVFDYLRLEKGGPGIHLRCTPPGLPTDSRNLVHRAAAAFRDRAGIRDGVKIHLEKRIPLAAGLGGGSGDAATTLLALNELFGNPLTDAVLREIASGIGSDVPFFLQSRPALATGRGENVEALDFFPALRDAAFILVHPGFGIPTAWAYENLARFPDAVNGRPGHARRLIGALQSGGVEACAGNLYNSLEAPALEKYPLLALFQEFFRAQGAPTLMSGSGSSTFAIAPRRAAAEDLVEAFKSKFGTTYWMAVAPIEG